jgi:hypothetical protein
MKRREGGMATKWVETSTDGMKLERYCDKTSLFAILDIFAKTVDF